MGLDRMGLWQLFQAGGAMMWPIALCSVFALAVMIERFNYLRRVSIDTQALIENILEKMKRHEIKDALKFCDEATNPIANILKAGMLKYDRPREQVREAMEDASLYEIPKLEKNLKLLGTIAHISPLLGLLGTLIGMLRCFQVIQAKSASMHSVLPADLAGGLWEALLTAIAGLVVAIPAYLAYNYLVSRVDAFILEMEKASTELLNFLAE